MRENSQRPVLQIPVCHFPLSTPLVSIFVSYFYFYQPGGGRNPWAPKVNLAYTRNHRDNSWYVLCMGIIPTGKALTEKRLSLVFFWHVSFLEYFVLMLRLALDISTAAIRCVSGFWHLVFLRILSEPKAREDLLILIQFLVTALLAFSLHNVSVRESYLKKKNLSANSTFVFTILWKWCLFP